MLVQFSFKNVRSFKEETVLDMTAVNAYKEHESNLIDWGLKEKFVRVASIYGANASGKSNLHLAMFLFQEIIGESFGSVGNGRETAISRYYDPFSFEDDNHINSEFQIIILLGDYEYRYGFEYNAVEIVAEWLYKKNLNTNRRAILFERSFNQIDFGATVRKECSLYQEQIPKETLVLSFFNKLNLKTDEYRKVYIGIMNNMVALSEFYENKSYLEKYLPQVIEQDKEGLLRFLNAIDVGIKDIAYDISGQKTQFWTYHYGKNGKRYELNLYDESQGTIKAIGLYINVRIAIKTDTALFIDEFNDKLHPLLLKFIIDLFYDERSKAQLIYTTHDTTLMDKRFFRRDQIWFVEKDEYGYSELAALSDYKVRSDASFEKDYLAGVYGGIPLLKEFDMKEGE